MPSYDNASVIVVPQGLYASVIVVPQGLYASVIVVLLQETARGIQPAA